VVRETNDLVFRYKISLSAWLTDTQEMKRVLNGIRGCAVDVILDGKFGDVPHMSAKYADFVFGLFDSVTVNPWGGLESIQPFLDRGRTFVWLSPSHQPSSWMPDWEHDNLGWVVGAGSPKYVLNKACQTRYPVLVPGIGPQGGDLSRVLQYGSDKDILTVSRLVEAEPRRAVTELLAAMLTGGEYPPCRVPRRHHSRYPGSHRGSPKGER
jgi:orotidine-5'-phosphate decarboxylase